MGMGLFILKSERVVQKMDHFDGFRRESPNNIRLRLKLKTEFRTTNNGFIKSLQQLSSIFCIKNFEKTILKWKLKAPKLYK